MKERIDTRIFPDLLDTIGRSFKFRHGKGVAEWLKNSLDAYLRSAAQSSETRTGGWPVLLWIMNGSRGKRGPNLAVVDFSGASFNQLDQFFLHWGDTTAASLGGNIRTASLTGGHGNGGKFYMREMWKDGARFLTWKDGRMSSLVVDKVEQGSTGYWERKNEPTPDWRKAFRAAFPDEDDLMTPDGVLQRLGESDPELIGELDSRQRGLSVVVGRTAKQVLSSNDLVRGKRWDSQRLVDAILDAPQARRPIRELCIHVVIDDGQLQRLAAVEVTDDPEWPPKTVELPGELIGLDQPMIGRLTIRKAAERLVGKLRDRNGIVVLDQKRNPVGWYPMSELAVPSVPAGRFLHGEVELDFPGLADIVHNDRERLVAGEQAVGILRGIAEALTLRLDEIEEAERRRERNNRLESAVLLNDSLNEHARRFLQRLESEVFADFIQDPTGGGPGPETVGDGPSDNGGGGAGGGSSSGGDDGEGGSRSTNGGSQKHRRPKFPQVLLSGIDHDPTSVDGDTKHLSKMDPPLYQDDEDRRFNVWWINASHPFAAIALEHGGPRGNVFRSHQLFMFRDVVQREAMRMLQRREAEMALDRLETELDEISNKFLGELPVDVVGMFVDNGNDE